MRASEILRKLADVIDSAEGGAEASPAQGQLQAVEPAQQDADSNQSNSGQQDKFVPPLQQKLEILKKSVGMDSVYGSDNDLGRMKQMAGLNPAQQEAADDEPLDV